MRDTAQLMSLAAYLTDSMMMPRARRAQLFRTWGSVLGMLPVGGAGVWGNASWAPDDDDTILRQGRSYGCVCCAVLPS
jgi:phospholipid:diacylglycerol acyltransferase